MFTCYLTLLDSHYPEELTIFVQMKEPRVEYQISFKCRCGVRLVICIAYEEAEITGTLPDLSPPYKPCPRCRTMTWQEEGP